MEPKPPEDMRQWLALRRAREWAAEKAKTGIDPDLAAEATRRHAREARPVEDVERSAFARIADGDLTPARDFLLDNLTTQNSPAEKLAQVAFPDYRSTNTAGIYADEPDLIGMASGMAGPIAFHGSPHVFDKFSSKKIGTGEGAQAYGHGLYFTSEPKVAEGYRAGLAEAKVDIRPEMTWAQAKDTLVKRLHEAADAASDPGAAHRTRSQANHTRKLDIDTLGPREIYRIAKDYGVRADDLVTAPAGSFHQVDIPDNLLDFEKPLHDQPETAKWGAVQAMRLRGLPESDIQRALTDSSYSGAKVYRSVGAGDDRIASEALRKAGIPGHRYKGDTSGVENYVVYDDNVIKPLGRYSSLAEYLKAQMGE